MIATENANDEFRIASDDRWKPLNCGKFWALKHKKHRNVLLVERTLDCIMKIAAIEKNILLKMHDKS